MGLPPPLPKAPPLGGGLPKLAIGGLGLSTIKAEGQKMTQEEMADIQQLRDAKNVQQAQESSSEQENEQLSSDEEYYREMERIKAEGEKSSMGQFEGGSSDRSGVSQNDQKKS